MLTCRRYNAIQRYHRQYVVASSKFQGATQSIRTNSPLPSKTLFSSSSINSRLATPKLHQTNTTNFIKPNQCLSDPSNRYRSQYKQYKQYKQYNQHSHYNQYNQHNTSYTFEQGPGSPNEPVRVAVVSNRSRNMVIFGIIVLLFIASYLLYRSNSSKDNNGIGSTLLGVGNFDAVPQDTPETRFEDVVGCDEAKHDLEEVVEFLRNPEHFTRLGGTIPKGVLLSGPPGTGKTLLARAVAGEASVPFFYASGSEFDEVWVGVGARRVRELYDAARKHAPCIIFLDEIDALASSRNSRDQGSARMTLNQLLAEMDGFTPTDQVVVIAATNFPAALDKALTRSGRFDKHVSVDLPDLKGREQLVNLYLKNKVVHSDVDSHVVARATPTFTGADIANMLNIAALRASVENKESITMQDIDNAKDRLLMGAERSSGMRRIDRERLLRTAYHEAGHALVCLRTQGSPDIHKATIVPRGSASGMVQPLPKEDNPTVQELRARIDMAMGGRAAESLIYGKQHVTTGASQDFRIATDDARRMVTEYGMSSMGPIYLKGRREGPSPSGGTMAEVDRVVQQYLLDAENRAASILKKDISALHSLANALLEHESLSGDEVAKIVQGKPLRKTKT
eukprot:gb/GECH01000478.1/.p1 GENE.gb/GECH01000478.1/~~gb/GECH01000478.1/.p1  ORF type:complete len:622 (+),score=75.98 gb/GECH01000478.1/:1-1866(+)